jgi:hypothetical protein
MTNAETKFMKEERVMHGAGIPAAPEFVQIVDNLIVVLPGTVQDFCRSPHWEFRLDSRSIKPEHTLKQGGHP